MRIAQVAPLYESVPPLCYGGTERVVSYLCEELVRAGHDVTLFASADSQTAAHLVPVCRSSLRRDERCVDQLAHHIVLLERVAAMAHEVDIIHFHIDYLHFPLSRRLGLSQVTTLHGRLDLPDLKAVYREFSDMPLVSISDAQRSPLAWANWVRTVHHGIPRDLYTFHPTHPTAQGYLAFVGRISPEKRVDRAIEVAIGAGIPLRIGAKVDRADREYFEREIEPLLDHPLVTFMGEIDDRQKNDLIGGAVALVFPIDWPEPFGLVMIESLACGTPVVAFRNGSVPELIDHGITGFIVDSVEEAVAAVERASMLDRRTCRETFERRFTAERMARDYVKTYERLVSRPRSAPSARLAPSARVDPSTRERLQFLQPGTSA